MRKFPYAVKYHGKFYPPNTPIEEVEETPRKYEGAQTADEEAAQKAENATENAEQVEVEEEPEVKAEPVKKAAKGRKKGDA